MSFSSKQKQVGIFFLACFCFFYQFYYFSDQHLLGFHGGEVYGHAWTHFWRLQNFPEYFLGNNNALGVQNFPPIDILPLFVSNCFALIGGTIFGYNAWIVIAVCLAGFGGYFLAETEGGDPLVGGFVLACSPIFLGTIHSGLTEDMGIGLAAFSLAFLRKRSLWGVLFLVLVGYSGLVLGWMTGISAIIIALADIKNNPKKWRQWAVFGIATLILISPLFWIHFERLGSKGHRFGAHVMGFEYFWPLNPWKQADIASLFSAGRIDFSQEIIRVHPAYLGIILSAVALFARARVWWLIFCLFTLCSFGTSFRFFGEDTGLLNPMSYLLELLPGYELINHHGRFLLLALIAWSVLVAKGAQYIQRWLPDYGVLTMIVLELVFLSPIGFQIPKTNSYAETILEKIELKQDDFLLRLPMIGPNISFQEALWEQKFHQEKILLSPNRPGIQAFSQKTSQTEWMEALAFPEAEIPNDFCLPKAVAGLVVLEEWTALIEEKMGPPMLRGARYSFWKIDSTAEYICD